MGHYDDVRDDSDPNYHPRPSFVKKDTPLELKEDDFGFTLVEEEDLMKVPTDDRAERIYKLILPLIKNLSAGKDEDVIKWPNRKQKLADFQKKIEKILKG
jgi:hypothetical protein